MAAIGAVKKFGLDTGSRGGEKRSAQPIRRSCSSSPSSCHPLLELATFVPLLPLPAPVHRRTPDWISPTKRITNKLSTVGSIGRWPLDILRRADKSSVGLLENPLFPCAVEFLFSSIDQSVEQSLFLGITGERGLFLTPLSYPAIPRNGRSGLPLRSVITDSEGNEVHSEGGESTPRERLLTILSVILLLIGGNSGGLRG